MTEKISPICGKKFEAAHAGTIYCSLQCRRKKAVITAKYWREKLKNLTAPKSEKLAVILPKNICFACGKKFSPTFNSEKFCSDKCRENYFGL